MDQQYTYYSTNQNGSQNPYTQPEKKPEPEQVKYDEGAAKL